MDKKARLLGQNVSRWLPLAALLLAMALVYAMGWHRLVAFETIGQNYEALKSFIADHFVLALLLYSFGYIAMVALSLPGGLVMTLSGGLLFGWQSAALATAIAATIGASAVFLIAQSSIGKPMAASAGPWLGRLRDGFGENALCYLLFLRLVPAFPFFVVNLAPALLGVPLGTYVVGTFFGIIPGTLAFSIAGSGLGRVIEAQNDLYAACLARTPSGQPPDCAYTVDISTLVSPELVAALVLLGLIALVPVAVKMWSNWHAA